MEQETWRILIVEDDRRLAELTQEYLQGDGAFEVSIEADGARAVVEQIDAKNRNAALTKLKKPRGNPRKCLPRQSGGRPV